MTYASALPLLSKLARSKNPASQRMVCGCVQNGQVKPKFHQPAEQVKDFADLDWSVCPLDLLENPFTGQVQALQSLADRGFPTDHRDLVAWAVVGLMHQAR